MKNQTTLQIGLICLVVAISIPGKSQGTVNLLHSKRITTERPKVELNLAAADSKYRTGTTFILAGAATTAVSYIMYRRQRFGNRVDKDNAPNPQGMYLGGALMTIGLSIQIDSFKYAKIRDGKKTRTIKRKYWKRILQSKTSH